VLGVDEPDEAVEETDESGSGWGVDTVDSGGVGNLSAIRYPMRSSKEARSTAARMTKL